MKQQRKRLKLHRETVRNLNRKELNAAVGGSVDTCVEWCSDPAATCGDWTCISTPAGC